LVSADHVGLAVVRDFLDLALAEIALHLTTVEPLGLSRQAHDSADLVKSSLSLGTERREDVTQINCILAESVEVGTRREPRRGYAVDHRPVAQHGEVEAVAVEGNELGAQRRDLVAEGADQLLLGPLAHVGSTDGVHRPMVGLAVCDERSNADDRVIDVLRKLVADRLALAAANPSRSGTVSRSQTMTVGCM